MYMMGIAVGGPSMIPSAGGAMQAGNIVATGPPKGIMALPVLCGNDTTTVAKHNKSAGSRYPDRADVCLMDK